MGPRTLQGYGQTKLVCAAVDMNFVFKTFKTLILLHNLEQNNTISVQFFKSDLKNRGYGLYQKTIFFRKQYLYHVGVNASISIYFSIILICTVRLVINNYINYCFLKKMNILIVHTLKLGKP